MSDTATAEQPTAAADDGWEWAIVEIFGHRKHAGRAREEERFGAKMLRIDIPVFAPARTLFDAADDKPSPPEIVWQTHYYGGSSIFSFTLTDEASVMKANKPYESPYRMRLPPPEFDPDHDRDDFDGDDEDR